MLGPICDCKVGVLTSRLKNPAWTYPFMLGPFCDCKVGVLTSSLKNIASQPKDLSVASVDAKVCSALLEVAVLSID